MSFGKFAGGDQPIHHGHDQIKNDDIGLAILGFVNGLAAILRLHDFTELRALQQLAQCGSNRRIVVGNQDLSRHLSREASQSGQAARVPSTTV